MDTLESSPAKGSCSEPPVTVWRFVDGRRGHDNQSGGLISALGERLPLQCRDLEIAPRRRWRDAWDVLVGTHLRDMPRPDLLVGAGSATHWAMLAARHRWGGRIVVLMNPGLPRRFFDLCIVPEHDGVTAANNTLISRGALNRMRPGRDQTSTLGLILVGGPSRHHGWDSAGMRTQIQTIARRSPNVAWALALSPRTPPGLVEDLRTLDCANVEVVAFDAVDEAWLPEHLRRAATVWVSEDSISMVYEAITAGAATGLLSVPRRDRAGETARGVDERVQGLVDEGLITPYHAWLSGRALRRSEEPIDEAARCAGWIVDTWLRPAR